MLLRNLPGLLSIGNHDNFGLSLCFLEIALPIQPSVIPKRDGNQGGDAYFNPFKSNYIFRIR